MSDQHWMQRALELAQLGMGNVSPNPMVGCVIVHENQIIGEGYHMVYGGPHAEVNAVESVENKDLLAESTAYVTLEPCSHFGKTPPCADLLIKHRLNRVVICNGDPNPLVAGRGITRMKDSGIAVEEGLLEDQGLFLNRRFFTLFTKNRPYVILKWAQTADGFVARENFDSKWISNAYSRQLVHKWRSEEAAILVGKNTALYDNPALTTRDWHGKNPVRVVIDRNLELPADSDLFDGNVKTICFTGKQADSISNLQYIQLDEITPRRILEELGKLSISSLIVEGGAATLNSFIDANLWDEARVFISDQQFGKGIKSPQIQITPTETRSIQNDKLLTYYHLNG